MPGPEMLDTARALLFVRNESPAPTVVRGLSEEQWRVREMCAKICRYRELAEGSSAEVLGQRYGDEYLNE